MNRSQVMRGADRRRTMFHCYPDNDHERQQSRYGMKWELLNPQTMGPTKCVTEEKTAGESVYVLWRDFAASIVRVRKDRYSAENRHMRGVHKISRSKIHTHEWPGVVNTHFKNKTKQKMTAHIRNMLTGSLQPYFEYGISGDEASGIGHFELYVEIKAFSAKCAWMTWSKWVIVDQWKKGNRGKALLLAEQFKPRQLLILLLWFPIEIH